MPYATKKSVSNERLERLRAACHRAATDPDLATTRAALLIQGIEILPDHAYCRMVEMEAEAGAGAF